MPTNEPHDGPHHPGPDVPESAAADDPAVLRSRIELVASKDNLEFLRRHLRTNHSTLAPQDAEDIADNVMVRLIARITSGEWVPVPNEAMVRSYLRTAVNWAVVDFYRLARRTHENPVPTEVLHNLVLTDDQAVSVLNRTATAADVRDALARIQRSGDATLFTVVTYVLDHIQRTGERPSNRQTGTACGLSHTAVANALVRLRPFFEGARETARDH